MKTRYLIPAMMIISLILAACSQTTPPPEPTSSPQSAAQVENTPTVEPTDSPPAPTDTPEPAPTAAVEASEPEPTAMSEETPPETAKNGKPLLKDMPIYSFEDYWATDFSLHTVPYSDILSGGVRRDGIPPIDNPQFESIASASAWVQDQEPVFVVTVNDETKAYPLQVLIWHEIVNDEVGGEPVAVTYCPLCNSAITFERTLGDTVYDFGVSGKLRNSDLIMWDRQTESWWQQLTGEAIVGELVGEQLAFIPTRLVSFADFKEAFPEAQVLSRDMSTVPPRPYGRNPYEYYDSNPRPFLFDGDPDPRLSAVDRVIAVEINGEAVAYPYPVLAEEKVAHDTVGGQDIVVFWQAGTTSALDASTIAEGEDVGAGTVYDPNLNGQKLTFSWNGSAFEDEQTGSEWNIFGTAISGELAGEQLTPVNHANHLWFAMAAFFPQVRIYAGGS